MAALSKPVQVALLATLVATALAALQPAAPAADVAADLLADPGRARAVPPERTQLPLLVSRVSVAPPPLGDVGYAPPRPPPPVWTPPPVVKPTAPPPPFVYLGRMERDGETVVFLGHGEEVETASLGQDITDQWRLEAIDEHQLRLRYLPLDETRPLMTSR